MAKVLVRIDLGNVPASEILEAQQGKGKCPEWFGLNGKLMVDEAFLNRSVEDDSFFDFEFVSVEE
jgi:hypothetical protein